MKTNTENNPYNYISFLTPEEKLEILKESFRAEIDIRKEWVNFWNEEI